MSTVTDVESLVQCQPASDITEQTRTKCRFCGTALHHTFVDLGMSPLCESYVAADHLNQMEPFYPLHVYVCDQCFLVQLEEYVRAEDIFTEYAYFSSYSDSWLQHCRRYVEGMIPRCELDSDSLVMEVASNDGYLLQYFVEHGIPVLGIEPAANIARVARDKGIPTLTEFFGRRLAARLVEEGRLADLIAGNNVLAQVPDINDFVAGLKMVLKPKGVITIEFPHLECLMREGQLDTIYHEHFSYFSFITAERIFGEHGLTLFDVDELPTHGGSLRIYARHVEDETRPVEERVRRMRDHEREAGFDRIDHYLTFAPKAIEVKHRLLELLIRLRREGHSVAGYGAPGKGNTLLNYCGIRTDLLEYTVDRSPYKQGRFLPGTHIPILHPDQIRNTRPDYILILPWNLKTEIIRQLEYIREWGGQFIVPIPRVQVY
jgi:SAM-dependent methyltransferase